VERNLVRTIARTRRDLPTKDIDVCALLNSRVRIVQKVRQFRYRDGTISEVSLQRNNQLVSQNVVIATLISPLHYHSLGTYTVSSQDISKYLDIAILAFSLVYWISVASHYNYTRVGPIWK